MLEEFTAHKPRKKRSLGRPLRRCKETVTEHMGEDLAG